MPEQENGLSQFQQQMMKPLTNVLVKPTSADCNLACGYCFYLEKSVLYPDTRIHRMPDDVMDEMVRQLMQAGQPSVSFGWQGGEPTLMGVDFYRKAVAAQQKYGLPGQTVGNGFQTNGVLIDEEWCDLLREYNFLIGLSIDGPEHVHDKYRVTAGGRPSWQKVYDSAKLMLKSDVAVNSLVVVNDYSVLYAEEIYTFLRDAGFEFLQFIPCVETDPNDRTKVAPFSVSPEQYGEFLCKIFDCWKKDFVDGRPRISVRFFDSVFHTYVGMAPPECTLLEECGCYVVIEHNGDVYSCDFFVEPKWKLGNVMTDNLLEMLNSPRQKEFGRVKSQLPQKCVECKYLIHCRGGCPKDRINNPQTEGLDHFCKSHLMFFEYADADMKALAEDWMTEQQQYEEESHRRVEELTGQPEQARVGRNEPCPCGSGKKYKKCCGRA